MAFAMLISMFTGLGGMFSTKAFAAEGVSSVKSYDELDAAKDEFIYLATEVYEPDADGEYALSDYYVDPGMKLKVRVFLKTDLYIGAGTIGFVHDNRFFDIQNGTGEYDVAATGESNADHADVAENGVAVTFNSMMISSNNVYAATRLTLPDIVVDSYTLTQADASIHYTGYKRDTSSTLCYEFNEDEYFYEYYVIFI
jgi:hypothetical protein